MRTRSQSRRAAGANADAAPPARPRQPSERGHHSGVTPLVVGVVLVLLAVFGYFAVRAGVYSHDATNVRQVRYVVETRQHNEWRVTELKKARYIGFCDEVKNQSIIDPLQCDRYLEGDNFDTQSFAWCNLCTEAYLEALDRGDPYA